MSFTAEESIKFICSNYAINKLYSKNQVEQDLKILVDSMRNLKEVTRNMEKIDITLDPIKELYNDMLTKAEIVSKKYNLRPANIIVTREMVHIMIECIASTELFSLSV